MVRLTDRRYMTEILLLRRKIPTQQQQQQQQQQQKNIKRKPVSSYHFHLSRLKKYPTKRLVRPANTEISLGVRTGDKCI